MEILELEDIQGYIIRGYSHMMYSRYVFLQVHNAAKAKQWISSIAEDLTTAEYIDDKTYGFDIFGWKGQFVRNGWRFPQLEQSAMGAVETIKFIDEINGC